MPLNREFNPFANSEIRISRAQVETLRILSKTQGAEDTAKSGHESIPFDRYVDVWIAAMALGVANKAFVSVEDLDRQRFIMGSVFQRDLDRIELILLIAIAHTGDPYVVGEARKVLDIAEGYATAGLPLLTEMINAGHLSECRNLARALEKSLTHAAE